jgi:hypothetical protein
MPTAQTSLESINDFLAQKRIAIVGISRDPRSMSAILFNELSSRGYDVVPVNPNAKEFMGRRCFARLQDIAPSVDAALLMTSPAITDTVVNDCAESGITRVWMYRGAGHGAVSDKAIEVCHQRGIHVIPGECPLMFLPHTGGIHHFHAFIRKLTRRYPTHSHA